ncbi:MAG: NAD(P)H-dependent oxidoreductase subunit E [Spirochaeta sp.]|jgi:NADH-quinone oxidoreductase subunit E|nr:NAD(P)H-dependent oxidoreductase subunit E [Spirochaeta sp.]
MATQAAKKTTLPRELIDFVDEWIEKPGNLIMILHKMQQVFGYIPRAEALELARYMDVPLAKIYGVITFYHYFKLKKPGKNKIQVCMGTACYLKGGQDLIDEIENLIGIGVNQTTDDDQFSMESVRCVGCCGLAPVVVLNDEVYGKLKKAGVAEVIAKHREA